MKNKKQDIIICGVGGQGIITLLKIIAQAGLIEGLAVKTSELHGLSQRGGSVETHARLAFTKGLDQQPFSPLVMPGKADLIIALEMQEGLRNSFYANSKTIFLINQYYKPYRGGLTERESKEKLNTLNNLNLISASQICQKKFQTEAVAGVFLLSLASFKKLILLKPNSVLKAIFKIVPPKYRKVNWQAFKLAQSYKNNNSF